MLSNYLFKIKICISYFVHIFVRLLLTAPGMQKKLLVFDFDGTIANTLAIAVEVVNRLSDEFGFPKVSEEEFMELKHKRIGELLRLSGLSWLQVPMLVKRARDYFKHNMERVNPINKIPDILPSLQERGYVMGILTSNTQDAVKDFLALHDLEYFQFIHAPDSIFGKSKVLREIMKTYLLKPEEVVMIGDEIRDIMAAKKAKVDSIAVTWGFNSIQRLEEVNPQHIIHDPEQLLYLFPPINSHSEKN